jgi:hypothetical protein
MRSEMSDQASEEEVMEVPPSESGRSEPPEVRPEVVGRPPAGAPLQHPLWARAAGKPIGVPHTGQANSGRSGASGGLHGSAGDASGSRRFLPIRAEDVEATRRNLMGGGDDDVETESVAAEREAREERRKRKLERQERRAQRQRQREEDAANDEAGSQAPELDDDDEDDDEDDEDDVQAAAFGATATPRRGPTTAGVGGGSGKGAARRAAPSESAATLESEDESVVMKEAMSAAFPLTGVTCVGCVHPHRILAINDYIEKNAQKVSKTALFKTAALLYQRDIREPALAEGVRIPGWSWRDIGVHYDVHAVEPKHQRLENVRTLANVRNTLEQSLMREDAESGERVLDKQNAELLLKVVTLQSKEISLFVDPPKPATANGKTAKTGSGSSGGTAGK